MIVFTIMIIGIAYMLMDIWKIKYKDLVLALHYSGFRFGKDTDVMLLADRGVLTGEETDIVGEF